MTVYCFDLDGTICRTHGSQYRDSVPLPQVINKINELRDIGHTILVFTARGAQSGADWRQFTADQLKGWGLRYHKLIMGKPHADVFIDDKAVSFQDWCRACGLSGARRSMPIGENVRDAIRSIRGK